MGLIRTLLALVVVIGHSGAKVDFIGGRNAVQMFYIISGFLMSYVLAERKSYKTAGAFYLSRYLRLYPTYIFIAALTLIEILIAQKPTQFFDVYQAASSGAWDLLTIANATLFGQDWVMFSTVVDSKLAFTTNFYESPVKLYQGLLLPQAWTLGVELTFYLVAPFILPHRKLVFGLLALSILVRVFLVAQGLGAQDPWTYRFFPAELSMFLFGAVAHQVLLPIYQKYFGDRFYDAAKIVLAIIVIEILIYAIVPLGVGIRSLILFGSFVLAVPFTFVFQNNNKIDAWIGNLSYPLYISHIFVFMTVQNVAAALDINNSWLITAAAIVSLIAFSIALHRYLETPIDKLRAKSKS